MSTTYSESGQHALDAALDWTKVSTALATGALVFGVGLTNSVGTSVPWIRYALAIAWALFFVSIVTGIFAQASLPVLMQAQNYDLESRPFTLPARIHQLAFFVAILITAVVLIRLLFDQPPVVSLAVRNGADALTRARASLAHGSVVDKLTVIELVKSVDPTHLDTAVWHIQFTLRCQTPVYKCVQNLDYLIESDGRVHRVE
jgi:hypothetical protein